MKPIQIWTDANALRNLMTGSALLILILFFYQLPFIMRLAFGDLQALNRDDISRLMLFFSLTFVVMNFLTIVFVRSIAIKTGHRSSLDTVVAATMAYLLCVLGTLFFVHYKSPFENDLFFKEFELIFSDLAALLLFALDQTLKGGLLDVFDVLDLDISNLSVRKDAYLFKGFLIFFRSAIAASVGNLILNLIGFEVRRIRR